MVAAVHLACDVLRDEATSTCDTNWAPRNQRGPSST
jgi:hypothetical protein